MKPAPSPRAARALVQALAAAGVREFVLAPGSRSAPLAYALADAARRDAQGRGSVDSAPAVTVHVRIDERDAAFLALGIAKAAAATGERRPVAVVTTSGTAVANLLPAVLEAHHSGVPLLVLTADRPASLRGTGANQTTAQPGLFDPAVRLTIDLHVSSEDEKGDGGGAHQRGADGGNNGTSPDGGADERTSGDEIARVADAARLAVRAALGDDPGPVHLNLAYADPLVPGDEPWPVEPARVPGEVTVSWGPASSPRAGALGPGGPPSTSAGLPSGPPTVVVAGDGAGYVARELAESRGWPLLAEPASGSRCGPSSVAAYRLLLAAWQGAAEVRRVVVVGRPTLSRPVTRLLAREDVEVVRVQRPSAAWPEAGRDADVLVDSVPRGWFAGAADDSSWLDSWRAAGQTSLAAVRSACSPGELAGRSTPRLAGPALAELVALASRPDDVLVIGSSNPVRDLDLVASWVEAPIVIGNRGLSGIDGMTATATGIALALPDRTVRALVGDLTFLHDVGGLLTGPLEERPHVQIVVANDDGGSVFATLEHGDPARAETFERFFATPHGADIAALCAGYGVRHRLARDAAEVAESLASPGPGLSVLEVRVDRGARRELEASLVTAVGAALKDGGSEGSRPLGAQLI